MVNMYLKIIKKMQLNKISFRFQQTTSLVHRACFVQARKELSHTSDGSVNERTVGITSREQQMLLKRRPVEKASYELLKVAIIGAPNAGKSTLLNRLLNWKIAPVSEKVHTTRSRTVGVLTEDEKQVVFLDTPGIITPAKAKRHSLEISLLIDPHVALQEADLVVVVVDVSPLWNRSHLDPEIIKLLHVHQSIPSILVLNKVDLIKPKDLLLCIVRNLTNGVVGNRKDWTTKKKNKVSLEDLFHESVCDRTVRPQCSSSIDPVLHTLVQDETVSVISSDASPVINSSGRVSFKFAIASNRLETADLHLPHEWATYYKRLCEVGKQTEDEKGWPHFDAVFMVSAVDGNGVDDVKNYLLDSTYPSQWKYHPSVVTDQDPIKLAKLVVRESLLNHLPDEVPYNVQVTCVDVDVDQKLSLWELENDSFLRAAFEIHCKDSRQAGVLLGKKGLTLRAIAAAIKQQLMNVFHKEMSLKLTVRSPSPGRESEL